MPASVPSVFRRIRKSRPVLPQPRLWPSCAPPIRCASYPVFTNRLLRRLRAPGTPARIGAEKIKCARSSGSCAVPVCSYGRLANRPPKCVSASMGPIPPGKLDEMSTMLYLADAGQKAGLLIKLGVDPKIAKYAAEQLMPGPTDRFAADTHPRRQSLRHCIHSQGHRAYAASSISSRDRTKPLRSCPGMWSTISNSTAGLKLLRWNSCRCGTSMKTISRFTV